VEDESKKDAKEFKEGTSSTIGKTTSALDDKTIRPRVGRPKIFGKKGNMKIKKQFQSKDTEKLQKLKMRSKSVKLRNVAFEMKNDANNEIFPPKNTPKNAKTISKLNNDICFDSKKIVSTIPGLKNKTKLMLSASKRKRPIDPVASLNASIKAKSQLRTQDGKFARNPNKDSPTKLLDNKINNGKSKNTDLIDDKTKLKTIQKLKKTEVQSPRRVTRLSSDSDNMPTLEPVVQIFSSNEEYTDKSVNDLPILSPVMSSSMSLQEQKISRTFTKYALKEKEGNIETQMEKDKGLVKTAFVPDISSEVKKLLFSFTDEEEDVLNTLEVISNDTGPRRSLRQSAPRLKTNDENLRESDDELNNLKSTGNIDFEIASKNNLKEQKSIKVKKLKEKIKDAAKQKEDTNEENRISKNNSIVLKEGRMKNKKNFSINNINNAEEISKTETVISKRDSKTRKEEAKETRSNSKMRMEKDSEKEVIKLPDVPFEVKKLLFSFTSEEEDVLSVLEVISNDTGPRRSLRQSAPKLKMNDEILQQPDDELDGSKNTSKKKKIEVFKKSFKKNMEKKNINDIIKTSSENDVANKEGQNEKDHSNKKDNRASAKTKEIKIDNLNIMEDKINTKGELSLEGEGDTLRKSNGILEKCRSRNRSVDKEIEKTNICAMEKQGCIANEVCNEKETNRQIEEIIDKANNKSESDDETDSNSDDRSDAAMINLNLSHLQSETSNLSIDSGKENSLETSVNVHNKLKLTRLKKTWGTRRERSSRKRSLSNVIGILTEGMNSKNIPVETQQSVQVLTVQTSLDNSDTVMCNGNAQQPTISDADNMIAVDTTFSELSSVVARNEEGSMEGEVITTMNITNTNHRMNENTQPCSNKTHENVFTSQNIDMSSNIVVVKTCTPSTDIILDLSRRKPKGKGSFLEKIVSKIAKQKDALFEGEVGSLLDTAADELTSILDEVGPTLADNTDSVNFDRTSYVSKDDNNENVMNTSTDKETLTIADSKIQPLEDSKIIVKDVISKRTTDLETQDNVEENSILEKTKRHIQNENQFDVNCILEKETLIEESQICKNKSAMKKEMAIVTPLEITNASQLSMTNISMENHNSLDLIQKTNSRDRENTKSKKKSRKRSLGDTTSFQKSKKRLIKTDEERVKDDTTPKELQFDDIIASIHKSEDTDNIEKKFIQKENETTKISNVDIGNETIQSKKSIKNDLELTKSEGDLEENCDRLNLKKLAYLSETICNVAKKSTTNTEDSIREVKIIVTTSKERTDVQLKESVENVKSALFSEKDIKHKRSMDETQTEKAIDMKELISRRVSKRKSQHVTVKNTPRIFVRPIDELKEVSSLSVTEDKLLKLSDEQLMKVSIIDTEENTSLRKSLLETASTQYEETQKIDSSSFVDSISSKTIKKRNAKKKSLADEHLELSGNESAKIAPKPNERSYMTNSNEQLSVSLEHFKIPEMTNMLQNAKKRYTKKKSLSENGHWNNEGFSVEHQTNEESIEMSKISNLVEKIEEQEEETEKTVINEQSRNRKRLERSNSSDLIGLVSSPVQIKSTFKKKTQLSNDDFANYSMQFHQNAESTDDLSESSCTSEYSYFRKKRFAKKKKREEKNANIANMRTINSSIVDPKIKTDKIKSLLDEHLDLSDSDDIDIPIDIQISLENTKTFEKIEREFELTEKSLNSQNKEKMLTDDSINETLSSTTERITSNNYDGLDDPIASKKRAADNFVVVHTKTGEILIVEKRKKLTKEMAKFFCDVCATSFTRKSSLKKHTLSQSHLCQIAKSKDKIELTDNAASTDKESKDWKNYETNNREANDISENIQCDNSIQKSLELNKYASYVNSMDERQMTNSLVNFEVNRQETLEDKLLDEEICKITENMSHDEYVLTDQLTPEQPISSSTPIKPTQEKQENSVQSKNGEKKRNKLKKRNLADEHLILDSPEIEKFKVEECPHINNVNNVSAMSYECNSTEKLTKAVEKMKEVIKEIQSLNTVETNNQTMSNLKFLNEETDSSKLSTCEVDIKFEQHRESTRTTRSTLRKLTKMNNEGKEENEISTELNRFSLRPRKSKNFIQHYAESDIENYVYFIDISEEFNDELENICDMQKAQNIAKKEMNEDRSREKLDTENKDTKDTKSKPDSTHDIKKRKRGRPKLKNRVITNSNIISVYEEFKIKENSSVTATAFESKVKNQKLDMCIKEMQHTDATIVLPPKRSRGRPRKNPVQTASNSTVQADNSNVSESIKPNCNETKEKIDQIEPCSDTIIEKITPTNLVTPLTLNIESLSAVRDYTLESNLLEKNPSDVEKIPCIDFETSNTLKNQSVQEIEFTNIKTSDNIHAKNYNMLSLNALPEKEKDDFFLPLEINMPVKDAECISEKKSTHDINVNISDHLLSQITENTSIIIDNPKLIERETIGLGENEIHEIEIQKPIDISELSEEKQTKLEETILVENNILEAIHKEMKLSSKDENETLITNHKTIRITDSYDLLSRQKDDLENDNDEKILLESLGKKSSKSSSQSMSKERDDDHKKSKTFKDRRRKAATSKISELSSDSENEGRVESTSSNKSKIVKSVFGRVFGCEKADKVKEVLNDWVSRSEDDSMDDVSRNASEAFCLRGSTNISENGYKKDKKHYSSSNMKNVERPSRKKGNDNIGIHGKSKNRKKKQEKDPDSIPEDRIKLPSSIHMSKRKSRESKIRADERILKTFDDESLIVSENENIDGIEETESQFENDSLNEKDKESKKYQEEEWNEEQAKNKNKISKDCEDLRAKHEAHGKSKNNSNYRKGQNINAQDEHSSSSSQFNMFKYRRRESKTKADEKIWRTFDNKTLLYLPDERDLKETHEMEETEFYEAGDINHLNDSKHVKQTDDDTLEIFVLKENQDQVQTDSGKNREDLSSHKEEDITSNELISIVNPFTDKHKIGKKKMEKIPKDFKHTMITENIQEKNDRTQNNFESFVYDTSKSINQEHNDLSTKLNQSNISVKISKRDKKEDINENWKHSTKNLKFDQKNVTENDQLEKDRLKNKESQRTCSTPAGERLVLKNLSEENSQTVPGSDNDGNGKKEEEEDDDEDSDNDVDKGRMSPLYARETPNSSIESSSNNEEEEEEDGEEEEEEQIMHEDNSRKTISNEFSGEKIIIRSPSSGHGSDVVTIAPTDAIEDNALDVPREIESTTESRQGKILNFDEELFVECCSRLKATSENELRGAKKIKLDHTESYHRRDDQSQGFKINKDRWRDVESQNSLGSLLESVNQVSIRF
jgi:hypothetical protein